MDVGTLSEMSGGTFLLVGGTTGRELADTLPTRFALLSGDSAISSREVLEALTHPGPALTSRWFRHGGIQGLPMLEVRERVARHSVNMIIATMLQ